MGLTAQEYVNRGLLIKRMAEETPRPPLGGLPTPHPKTSSSSSTEILRITQ